MPTVAERVTRAQTHFPALFAYRAQAAPATRLACGALERLRPRWQTHPVPPDQQPRDLIRGAVALATDWFNATRGPDLAPLTSEELLQTEEIDTYEIAPLPDGTTMRATLVNTVYKAEFEGASVYVPWATSRERVHAISPLTVTQRLLGVASVLEGPTAVRQFRVSYRSPFRCNHDISPAHLKVQETGAMSSEMGDFTLRVTVALHALACGMPRLRVTKRRCDNRVYVAYLPFRLSIVRLLVALAGCDTQPTRFGGTVVAHPELNKIRLIVFPTGVVICVGAKQTEQMRHAFALFMGRLHKARARPEDGRAGTTRPPTRKRARRE